MKNIIKSLMIFFFIVYSGLISLHKSFSSEDRRYMLAVLDLKSSGIAKSSAMVLSWKLSSHISELIQKFENIKQNYQLIDDSQVDKIYQQFISQSVGVISDSTSVEFGKILQADRIITGSVSIVGESYNLSARMIDVESNKIIVSVERQYQGPIDNVLNTIIQEIGNELLTGKQYYPLKDERVTNTVSSDSTVKESSESAYIHRINIDFHALLIGIDQYDFWADLSNPVNDVKTLAAELDKNYGFTTTVVLNADKSEVLSIIRDVAEKRYNDNSELLIVLSGHGYFDEFAKTGYFVPANGKKPEDDRFFDSYIAYPILQNIITNTACKHVLLVLNACYGGTFNMQIAMGRGEEKLRGITAEEFVKRKLAFKTRLMLSSGGREYVSDGRPGQHSPFMYKFLEGLRGYGGENKILTVEELKENYMNYVEPQPYLMEFQGNEPGSSFIFIAQ